MESSTPGINESLRNAKLLLKKSKRVDYYKLLEISQDANDYDIKKVGCQPKQATASAKLYAGAERHPRRSTQCTAASCSPGPRHLQCMDVSEPG